jgi:hypothetical protein
MVAAISNGAVFTKGRDFGAWVGLVPRTAAMGGPFAAIVVHRCAVVEDRPPEVNSALGCGCPTIYDWLAFLRIDFPAAGAGDG